MSRPTLYIALLLALVAAVATAAPVAVPEAYLPEDVQISGLQMHSFAVDGEAVSVVLGQFAMSIGGRSFSGRDAVVWIDQVSQGPKILRTIEAYIEGDATITEPGGTVTRDRAMLVTVRQCGALRASVATRSAEPVTELPLYRRAAAMRAGGAAAEVVRPPAADPTAVPDTPTAPPRPTTRAVEAAPQPPSRPVPVAYRAGETQVRQIPRDDGRAEQVTICRGDVYVYDGGADLIPPVQIQADAAVLFTADPPSGETEADPALGLRVGQLYVTSAYLEGDVRITSGEHSIRGSQLLFDFVHRRAVILDAVYHTIQPQRNIPIYVRAQQVRWATRPTAGGAVRHEAKFRHAKVSTSEFYTPTYHIGAAEATFTDVTRRNAEGEAVEPPRFDLRTKHATLGVRGVPFMYLPWTRSNLQDSDVPIRRLQMGDHGRFGFGAESDWHLFGVLGLNEPEGYDAVLELDGYAKATGAGVDVEYARDDYVGYLIAYGVRDHNGEDDFGRDREDIPAPDLRGRWLWRHKQFLPDDWQLQAELSYLCDRNFLEAYDRDEFWSGKDQDSLIYAKKQQDNWAFTVLTQGRVNDFQTTTEAFPEVGWLLIGERLGGGPVTAFSEIHAGVLRLQPGAEADAPSSSDTTARVDSRVELQWPTHWGPVNVMPYTFGRATYWSRGVDEVDLIRAIGGGGVKANMNFWRIYEGARSRLLDIHRIRHVVTPEAAILMMAGNVNADEVYPFTADVEQHVEAFSGATVGVRQRWQTYRGREGERRAVDLARAGVWGSFFTDTKDPSQLADGQFFMDRPEYSIARNALNGDFAVNVSDSTVVLGDMNYDLNDDEIGLANLGVAVQRGPRYRTYLGTRYMDDLDSWVWTAGVNYQLSHKYELAAFQQYDLDFDGGVNLQTRLTLIRKLPRWYVAVSVVVDRSTDEVGFVVTLWPEGMPEFRIGGSRVGTWASSERN